jgi:hypothetical protein
MSDSLPQKQDKQRLPLHRQDAPNPGTGFVINKRSFRYSLLLGAVAGLAFSVALWGYEAILFILAHVAYAWLPVLAGTFLCISICVAAALLTWLFNRGLLGMIFWILAARLVAELAIIVPLKIVPTLMKLFEPGLQSRLPDYPITAGFRTWIGIGAVWLAIFFGILGLLQLTLVESSVPAVTAGGRSMAYFIFVPVMILASVLSSNMISEQLRLPLMGTDKALKFAIDNQGVEVNPALARSMHLASFKAISNLLDRHHRLFLGEYDEYYSQANVLIDFHGEWVECTTVSGQPVMCNSTANP